MEKEKHLMILVAKATVSWLFGFERSKVWICGWKRGKSRRVESIQFLVRGKQTMRYVALRRGEEWDLVVCV